MSLVLFYVLHQEYVLSGSRRLKLMARGFLALGILDVFHAVADPGTNLFVWYHSLAALLGAWFLAAGAVMRNPRLPDAAPRNWSEPLCVAMALAGLGLASYYFAPWLPAMTPGHFRFSAAAHAINVAAGIGFLVAGVWLLDAYRRKGERILLVFALFLLLLAESQALFPASRLWDTTWWAWHWIKTALFIAMLLQLAYEFAQGVGELEASQAQLVESEKLASLGEMAASLAHEIRNPLATINNSVALLKGPSLSADEKGEILDILERELNHLNHVVSDTLSFARTRVVRRRPVALAQVIGEALNGLRVEPTRLAVATDIEPALPDVVGDPHQLQQMIVNLLDNAVAAMKGTGRLEIRASRDGDTVVLAIRDSGPGVPESIRARLFEPFSTTKPDGTGIGLAIVRRIVNGHGGVVHLDSPRGRGTMVTVRLPALAGHDAVMPAGKLEAT